jgi:2-(1,2-epoxy-1,2-dihydrophenyl)acetyl-CoA isomerase
MTLSPGRGTIETEENVMDQSDGTAWGVADGIGRIELQRPEQGNTLTLAASRAFARAVNEVLACRPRAVLLTAQGRIFCAGGDIGEFVGAGSELGALIQDILMPLHPALHKLATAPMPVVAAVNGAVAGAGIGLALCADFVLGATSMKLRTGYAAIGLSPDAGASYFLARRVGALRAQQWLMLSETIDAKQCLHHGVIDALCPDAELVEAADAMAHRLANAASASLAGIKALCGGFPSRDLQAHLDLEQRFLLERAGSADGQEGVQAFLEKRPPKFTGM